MKNAVLSFKPECNKLGSYRKEKHGLYKQYALLNLDRSHLLANGLPQHESILIIRVYWPAETAYACLWVSTRDYYAIGKGKAGGYGYCKESAAIDAAFRDAGVQLEHSVSGVGEVGIYSAIKAFAEFAGYANYTVTVAHT